MIILLISCFFLFFTKKIEWPFVGLIILANKYLGLGGFFEPLDPYFAQSIDPALVLFGLICIKIYHSKYTSSESEETKKIQKYIKLFMCFIAISIVVDFLFNGIDLWSVLRTSRHWILLLAFFPLSRIPQYSIKKLISHLYYITLVISCIIVIEFVFDFHYFTTEEYETFAGSTVVTRGALPSTYAAFYALLVAIGYKNYNTFWKIIILGLLVFSLLLSATKSIALGILLGFTILIFIRTKNKFNSLIKIIGVGLVAFGIVMAMPSLRTRLVVGQQSFGDEDDGSSTFRMMLVEERFNYVTKSPTTFLFGIGNVTEDKFKGHFIIGHRNSEGDINQLDTADIAWALSVLRLGILGSLLLIGMFVIYLKQLWNYIYNPYAVALISYLLLHLLVLSFAGVDIYYAYYWILPLALCHLIFNDNNLLKNESNTY